MHDPFFDLTKTHDLLQEVYDKFPTGNHEKDIHELTECIERLVASQTINKDNQKLLVRAHCVRGRSYAHVSQHLRAISDYTKAIDLDSDCVFAYYARALSCSKLDNYDQAITDCIKAISLNPDALSYVLLGDCYLAIRDYNQAITSYTKGLDIEPDNLNASQGKLASEKRINRYSKSPD